jgi:prepilin-type N-terminal cleavage/methylation domain-containing protein
VSPTSLTILLRPRRRRGFNLVEMLIALAITAALLSATMVALDASFMAYQTTTEVASTHTVSRLAMLRLMTLIRTGQEFGPFPINPQDSLVESAEIEFLTPGPPSQLIRIEWFETPDGAHPAANALYVVVDGGTPQLLLEGVIPAFDEFDVQIMPFTLEYELGRRLYRATVDITIVPDDNMSVELDGDNQQQIRLVASAMPRIEAYQFD